MFDRIVVPLDGSRFAERALAPAEELARLTGARLHLIRVVDISQASYGMVLALSVLPGQAIAAEEESARTYLDGIRRSLLTRDLQATTEVRRGPAARVLVAASQAGDTVVMATHGRDGAARWFLGSVAEEVVRHASVPVLLIRVDPERKPPTGKRVPRNLFRPAPQPSLATVPAVTSSPTR